MSFTPEDITALVEALKPMITEISSKAAADHVTKRNESYDKKLSPFLEKLEKVAPSIEEEPEKLTLKEDLKRLREELKNEKDSNQRKNMRNTAEAILLEANLSPREVKALSALLIHDEKLIDVDKLGNPVFKVSDFETVPIKEGLTDWLKNDGKSWIPAPQARGTGQKTIKSNSTLLDSQPTLQEFDNALMTALRKS